MAGDEGLLSPDTYERFVTPRYAQFFTELLLGTLVLPPSSRVLDLACRAGGTARAVLNAAPDTSLVALDSDVSFLSHAQTSLDAEAPGRVRMEQSSPEELSFGANEFSHVVGNLVDRVISDRGVLLFEAGRVLMPGGQLVLTMPLRGSFLEVLDMLREVALKYDLPTVSERVEQYVESLPSGEALSEEVASNGFSFVEVDQSRFTLDYESAAELFGDPAMHVAALPEWQWCASGAPDPMVVLDRVQEAIDTYFHGRMFELTVVAGCLSARKPGNGY